MVAGEDITIGELARRLDRVERQLSDGFREMNRTIESQQFIHIDRYEAEMRSIDSRVTAVEGSNRWLTRTVTGSLISAIVAALLALLVARGGI